MPLPRHTRSCGSRAEQNGKGKDGKYEYEITMRSVGKSLKEEEPASPTGRLVNNEPVEAGRKGSLGDVKALHRERKHEDC